MMRRECVSQSVCRGGNRGQRGLQGKNYLNVSVSIKIRGLCMCVWWFSRCLKCPKIISTRVLVETRCSSSSPDSYTGSHIFYTFILLSYFKIAFVSSEHVPSVVKCEFTSFSK